MDVKKRVKMEFQVPKQDNPNIKSYSRDELVIAYRFARRVHREFGDFLKAIVLFGSTAKHSVGKHGDIDLLIVVDDVTVTPTQELVEAYRIIVEKLVTEVSTRLHITTIKLTTFWEYIRAGDPVGMNILRDGVALLDTGFFDPLRALLMRGRVRPSEEAVWTYFARAPRTLHNAKWHVLQAVIDMYWAVIDAAHAALMMLGETPPSPDHVAALLQEKLIRPSHMHRKYALTVNKFYLLQKRIMHREIRELKGSELDALFREAQEFVGKVDELINKRFKTKKPNRF
ncbi:nucleotidyltransferase domain-containing protein [Candidatus Woesearchaeota archaeon]|nr:nucleotidyltransferase domain-containing protein [Candidatus Woesearchaeota archaeon]